MLTVYCNDCSAALITEEAIKGLGLEKFKTTKSRLKIIEEYVRNKKKHIHTHRKSTMTNIE